MKLLLLLLLLTSAGYAQDTTRIDTIPVYVVFQPYPGSALTGKDAYLIKGQLWYRSTAAFTKGRWLPFRKSWKVIQTICN